jgi:hypothetical protein
MAAGRVRGQPGADAIVDRQFHARRPLIGKKILMVRMGFAKLHHDPRQQPIGIGAHVDGQD